MVTLPAPESLARRKVLMRSSRYSASLVGGRPVMEGGEGGWRGRRGKGERERAREGGEGGRRGREEREGGKNCTVQETYVLLRICSLSAQYALL